MERKKQTSKRIIWLLSATEMENKPESQSNSMTMVEKEMNKEKVTIATVYQRKRENIPQNCAKEQCHSNDIKMVDHCSINSTQ